VREDAALLIDDGHRHRLDGTMRPKALVTAWVGAFNHCDADRLASFYAPDAVSYQLAERPIQGREAIRKMFADAFTIGAMVRIVSNIFEDGEWVILESRDPKGRRGFGFFHVRKEHIVFEGQVLVPPSASSTAPRMTTPGDEPTPDPWSWSMVKTSQK
jgi:hypothetical protein